MKASVVAADVAHAKSYHSSVQQLQPHQYQRNPGRDRRGQRSDVEKEGEGVLARIEGTVPPLLEGWGAM